VTYGPIIQTCNGKFSTSLLGSLAFAQDAALKEENKFVFGAIEQTLVSQLVLIPCKLSTVCSVCFQKKISTVESCCLVKPSLSF
jgi:hypothetical protein